MLFLPPIVMTTPMRVLEMHHIEGLGAPPVNDEAIPRPSPIGEKPEVHAVRGVAVVFQHLLWTEGVDIVVEVAVMAVNAPCANCVWRV